VQARALLTISALVTLSTGTFTASGAVSARAPRVVVGPSNVVAQLIAPAVFATSITVVVAPATCSPSAAAALSRTEGDWILQAIVGAGAITQYPDRRRVDPYVGNFAALGLARATAATCDRRYVDAAWRHLAWYASAMDEHGYVRDQAVINSQIRPLLTMDSTDAYAGTFLVALGEAYRVDPDDTKLRLLQPGLVKAVQAIASTTRSSGLTNATPTWPVAYLMDEAETEAGLQSAAFLANALGDSSLANDARTRADHLHHAVDALWNEQRQSYNWAVHPTLVQTATDWRAVYPDAMQQSWATAWGLADPARAAALDAHVAAVAPRLDQPSSSTTIDGKRRSFGYWPVAGWAGAVTDPASGLTRATDIQRAADALHRAWPFSVATSGQLIVLATGGWVAPTGS
jgi:hypothetical protein